jgi:hemolysin activation/secretion protein
MSKGRRWRAGLSSLVAASVAFCAAAALGAPSPLGLSREQVNPAQQIQETHRKRPPDVFSGPIKEPCRLSDSPRLAFDFKQAVIQDDARILSEADRRFALGDLVGKRITPRQLCDVRDRLAERVFKHWVLARVVIPPQVAAAGLVKFQILPARIVSVRFDGDDIGPAQKLVEGYLNHLRHQNAFNLNDVQKWLLLVNDIPGVGAMARIVHSIAPGAPPEGLDLLVTLRRTPINESAMVANLNSPELGPWTGLARVDLNSLTPLGERTSLVFYGTLGNFRQDVFQILESARLGESGLFGQASFAYAHSRPGNELAPLDLTGESYTGSFEIDYPLIRLQRESLILASGMDFANQTTTFPPDRPISDDALRVVWVRADGSLAATDRPWGDALVSTAADLSVQARKGLEILGASEPGAPALSRPGGFADAWVVRAEGHASVRLAPAEGSWPALTFTTHMIGQWADRPLLSYEQQAIGNLTVGRGYDPAAAAGDDVIGGEIKAEVGPLRVARTTTVAPYVFYDVAYVGYLGTDIQDVTLRSLGGGMEFRIPYDRRDDSIRMDLGYAKPLDRPVAFATKKPPERFLVQIIMNH